MGNVNRKDNKEQKGNENSNEWKEVKNDKERKK